MSNSLKFVCRINENDKVKEAYDRLSNWQKQADDKRKFLKQQLKTLEEEKTQHWRALWDAAKDAGFIEPGLDYDDYNLSLGDNRSQLFIERDDGGNHPLAELLGSIIVQGKPPI